MEKISLGSLIEENAYPRRDAIHLAVLPVVAGEDLKPGQRVTIDDSDKTRNIARTSSNKRWDDYTIGIVDPFLTENVEKGQKCWVVMDPYTVHSLRHEWSHSRVKVADHPPEIIEKAKASIANLANKAGLTYNELMDSINERMRNYREESDWYPIGNDILGWNEGHGEPEDFWENFKIVTGFAPDGNPQIFTCPC